MTATDDAPNDEVTDNDLFESLESALADFPNLKTHLPADYPRGAAFKITIAQMKEYSKRKAYWHQLNLPLILHNYRANPDKSARQVMCSLLEAFDDCVSRCGSLPGLPGLLEPLWKDAWSFTPQVWSIVGSCYLALSFRNFGIEIIGFEQRIGAGPKLDDIAVKLDGRTTHVEVEAFHNAEFEGRTDEEVIRGLTHRADLKAAKFTGITDEEVGVVAVLCVVKGADVRRHFETPIKVEAIEGQDANIKWMGCRLVQVREGEKARFALVPL